MRTSVIPDFASERSQTRIESLRRSGKGTPEEDRQRLRSAAKEFEGIMVELMVKEMRKNVPESPVFGANSGREIFQEMLDSQFVKKITDSGGIGLAEILVDDLTHKIDGRPVNKRH